MLALTTAFGETTIGEVAGMKQRVALFCGVIWMLAGVAASAQSSASSSSPAGGFGLDPEDAYVTPTGYTNAHFGFTFDFPDDVALKPVPMPAAADRRIQLLEMSGSAPEHGGITLNAYEYKNKNYTDAKSLLRTWLDQELFVGVEELHGIGKTTVGGRPFYYYETRKGTDHHVVLAGQLDGYVLSAELRARDPKLVHELQAAFSKMEFFPPQEAERRAGSQAKLYQGPAISAQHLREVRESLPGDHIDPGKIKGNVYTNAQIGMTYEFPEGWNVEPEGAVEPSVERYREKVLGEPLLGPRERAVVKACRRTLLSVWRSKPQPDGEVPYDDFGEVTLSTMPLACFPNIHFPENSRDAAAVRQFVVGLSFTLPLQRDMNMARTYEAGGKTFVLTHGTIAYKAAGEALSRRISVALAMTVQRGYLLIWLFAAPHENELRELLAAKVGFEEPSSPARTPQTLPGGGMASQETTAEPKTTLSGEGSEAADPATQAGADAAARPAEPGASPPMAAAPTQTAPPRPSLENPPPR
jgi:hypothetical protein